MKPVYLISSLLLLLNASAWAFPPAPDATYFGSVRDERGRPLDTAEGEVIVMGTTAEITRSPIDSSRGRGVNYSVHMPMDGNTITGLYQVSALRPTLPFTIKVVIRNKTYVPIQMTGQTWVAPKSGQRVRLDLSLGIDSDGDGLPDSWEQGLIDSDESGKLAGLADVKPGDDLDGDGLSNLQEYQIGTYALDRLDGLAMEIDGIENGKARLRFAVVAGRTYRIKSSPTLGEWSDESFAISATAAVQPYLRAADTTIVEVLVPLNNRPKLLFRLYAE